MKIKIRKCGLLLIFLLLCVIFWKVQNRKTVPEYVFSYAENQDADYPTALGAEYFSELVEERTGGRIRILVQSGGQRGEESEVVDQLRYGGVDFARVSLTELTDDLEELNVLQMPYLYRDSAHMWEVLDGEIGDAFLKAVDQLELVGLSWYDAGARNFYTADGAIRKPEDLAGKKIRVQDSALMADLVKCLGAEPVQEDFSEVYSLLERGLVQGAENNWPSYEKRQHYEVAGYYTLDEHMRIPEIQLCSRHTWEKLSKEDQTIISECARESAVYQRGFWQEQEKKSEELALEFGVQVIRLSEEEKEKFRQATEPLYQIYCQDQKKLIVKIRQTGSR